MKTKGDTIVAFCATTKKGNDSRLLCYAATKQKEKGDNSVATVAFFVTLQRNKKKKVTIMLLPSPSLL
jgi:hypothetical protein